MSVARFALSYMCVYFVLNELFFWLDETPLRHRGIFGATSWHVVHVFHSMLFFFSFCFIFPQRLCASVARFASNRLTFFFVR